ncbi:hypothetical protein UlMin_000439 [Ulmus minor]
MDISTMNHVHLTQLGSVFRVMLTMHFTVQLLSQHLFYWKNPKEHKAIVIIILMAPIYAIVLFVGLLDIKGSKEFFMLLELVKECYEALFLALIYSYLNISISKNIVPDGIKGREIHHSFPMTLFQLLKYWTWLFVVIYLVCSILMITLELLNIYPSWLRWAFTIILNVLVSLAVYSLVKFYHVFAKELAPHKPLVKFFLVYIDDMLVKSLLAEQHLDHLRQAFEVLRKYNMKLNPTKCSFGVASGKFVGYMVTQRGIEANLD